MRVVAIYARVSTSEQSPEPQLRELREYAARRGFAVHREYVDQASGDMRRRRRAPAFDKLMADARRRRFDCVLVWKYDRFARSLGALIAALQEFCDLGVDFISHNPGDRHHDTHGSPVLPRNRVLRGVRAGRNR
jgi:DNA invertase Pin-like site-specific DNA recombinase